MPEDPIIDASLFKPGPDGLPTAENKIECTNIAHALISSDILPENLVRFRILEEGVPYEGLLFNQGVIVARPENQTDRNIPAHGFILGLIESGNLIGVIPLENVQLEGLSLTDEINLLFDLHRKRFISNENLNTPPQIPKLPPDLQSN